MASMRATMETQQRSREAELEARIREEERRKAVAPAPPGTWDVSRSSNQVGTLSESLADPWRGLGKGNGTLKHMEHWGDHP